MQKLANQKHCGNKSAAIREALYKEAGVRNGRVMEVDGPSVSAAESRATKYGSRRNRRRK
jgi:hypothetical protein